MKKKAQPHIHHWIGRIAFYCKCGVKHQDRVYVGRDGALFIDRFECEREVRHAEQNAHE